MRQFDIKINHNWITGIFADDLDRAKRLAKQVDSGRFVDYREYALRNGEWVEVMV